MMKLLLRAALLLCGWTALCVVEEEDVKEDTPRAADNRHLRGRDQTLGSKNRNSQVNPEVASSGLSSICKIYPSHRLCTNGARTEAGGSKLQEELLEKRQARRKLFPKHCLLEEEMKHIETYPFFFGDDMDNHLVDDSAISLVTHFSLGETKLQRLLDIVDNWGGIITAVVYVDQRGDQAFKEDLSSKIQTLIDFYAENSEKLSPRVRFHLVFDHRPVVFKRIELDDSLHYPHNLLRNLAVDLAETDQVFVSDVDFIPSKDSHEILKSQWGELTSGGSSGDLKKLLILPAFERDLAEGESETMIKSQDLPPTKDALIDEINKGEDSLYDTFHSHYVGHTATNFARWYKGHRTFKIKYELFFEPYFVMQRTPDLPLFWEHFTGFGRNKQSWVEELALANYEFYVNSEAFLVHINHSHSSSRVKRPAVIREYVDMFQTYLREAYPDKSYWTPRSLEEEAQQSMTSYFRRSALEQKQ